MNTVHATAAVARGSVPATRHFEQRHAAYRPAPACMQGRESLGHMARAHLQICVAHTHRGPCPRGVLRTACSEKWPGPIAHSGCVVCAVLTMRCVRVGTPAVTAVVAGVSPRSASSLFRAGLRCYGLVLQVFAARATGRIQKSQRKTYRGCMIRPFR